jgi:hypothetical protein
MKDAQALQIAGTGDSAIAFGRTELVGMIDLTSFRLTATTGETTSLIPDCHVVPLSESGPVDSPPKIQSGATARPYCDHGDG